MADDVKALVEGLDEEKRAELVAALGIKESTAIPEKGPTVEEVAAKVRADIEAEAKVKADQAAHDKKIADDAAAEQRAKDEEEAREKALAEGKGKRPEGQKSDAEGGEAGYGEKRYSGPRRGLAVKDFDSLLDMGPEDVKASGSPAFVEDFQRFNDDMLLRSRILHQGGRPHDIRKDAPYRDWWEHKSVQATIEKALYTGGTGHTGEDWIPQAFSQSWIEQIGTEGEVLSTFERQPIPQGAGSMKVPVAGRDCTLYLQGEAATDEPAKYKTSTPTSGDITLTPKTVALRTVWSQEFVEDAVAGSMDRVRRNLQRSAALGLDEAIVYGDASANGFDSGAAYASDDRRKAFDGLRYHSYVTTSAGAEVSCASITWTSANKILAAKAAMGKWAGDSTVMLVDKSLAALLGLIRDTQGNLVSSPRDNSEQAARGPRQVLDFLGCRVIPCEALRTDLAVSGLYTASTGYTAVLFYNPEGFIVGTKRDWTVEVEKTISTGVWELVMTARLAFGAAFTAATDYTVGYAYGLVVASSW